MLVFTAQQMRKLENTACQEIGCSLEKMMENAGAAAVRLLRRKAEPEGKKIAIVCGKGNNGGDGFICAGLLSRLGAIVTVILVEGAPSSTLAQKAFKKLPTSVVVIDYRENRNFAIDVLLAAHWIIDGIFGFGFHGKVHGNAEEIIQTVNQSTARVLALDIPSGLACDTGLAEGVCVQADYTATFSALKPAHILASGKIYCGEVTVAPVGIPSSFIENFQDCLHVLEKKEIQTLLPLRDPSGNKGTFGNALCICGSEGMAGAAVMAGSAALRGGAGLVTMAVTPSLYPLVAAHVIEPVYIFYQKEDFSSLETALKRAKGILIGCGLGKSDLALNLVSMILEKAECPVILDADGINLVAGHIDILKNKNCPVVLTPHPLELSRLTGLAVEEIQADRPTAALQAARQFSCTVVLKGSGTIIATPEGTLKINTTGNDGMAKGGSGDVLAGLLVSLAAQGLSPEDFCSVGVYCHGAAGDLCAQKLSRRAMLPTDMVNMLSQVFLEMETR